MSGSDVGQAQSSSATSTKTTPAHDLSSITLDTSYEDIYQVPPEAAMQFLCHNIELLISKAQEATCSSPRQATDCTGSNGESGPESPCQNEQHQHEAERTPTQPGSGVLLSATGAPLSPPEILQHEIMVRKFNSKSIPAIPVAQYLQRIDKFLHISTAAYLAASYYITRLAENSGGGGDETDRERFVMPVTQFNCHRLLAGALRVALKAIEDFPNLHTRFAQVTGLSNTEVSRLEIHFCYLMDFELCITSETLQKHWDSRRTQMAMTTAAAR